MVVSFELGTAGAGGTAEAVAISTSLKGYSVEGDAAA
jgi:hypothetical protein